MDALIKNNLVQQDQPLLSIITVVYNNVEGIKTAIESVISQDYAHIEYIVVDGGSQDGTLDIINDFQGRITHMVSEPDKGIYDAMNKGISLATGDVIGILNSDDFYPHSGIISQVVQAFKDSPNTDLLLGNVDFVDAKDLTRPVRFYSSFFFVPWKMRFGFMPAHPGAFIKKSAYDEVGFYKIGYKIGADFDMFVRMLMVKKMHYTKLNQTLVRMRVGGVSTSGFQSYFISTKEMLRSFKENQVYSNILFILMRLPVKFFQLVSLRLSRK
jgi:glycosyltransferase involved in cell wall biosynthesis